MVTLTYPTSGGVHQTPHNAFIVSVSSISKIVAETCFKNIEIYQDEVMLTPSAEVEWQSKVTPFEEWWNMHHTLGYIDNNIRIKKPTNFGSAYFNGSFQYYSSLS